MNPLLRGLVLRQIARHRLRSALAAVAVALGVAAFLASVAVSRAVVETGAGVAAAAGGGADLVVAAEETGLPASLPAVVRAVPGVRAAAGVASQWMRVAGIAGEGSGGVAADGGARALVLGADFAEERKMRRRTKGGIVAPQLVPATDDPMLALPAVPAVLSRPLDEALRAAGESRLRLRAPRGVATLAPLAVVDAPPGLPGGGRFAVVPLAAASTLFGRTGRVDRIDVTVEDGADTDRVAAAVAAAVRDSLGAAAPPSLRVDRSDAPDPSTRGMLGAAETGLRIGALVSLLVGVFLIHHTISVGVAERRREVGILRALGATRRQVTFVFCAEALILGAAGSALGVAAGTLLATGALEGLARTMTSAYFPGEAAPVEMPAGMALAGFAAGLVTALVAALGPARAAAAAPPDDAIRRGPEEAARGGAVARGRIVAAACFLAIAGAAVLLPRIPYAGYVAALSFLGAFVAAAPILLQISARALAPVLSRTFGVPGRLAAGELSRNPSRAALPAAALAVGLALVVENFGVMTSLSRDMRAWMDANVAGDVFVSSGAVAIKAGGHTSLDGSLREEILRVPGVRTATGVRTMRVPYGGTRVLLLALDMEGYRPMQRVRVTGPRPRDEILADVQGGGACVVSENFMTIHGVGVGGEVTLPAATGAVTLRVAGTFPDFSWPRGTVLLDRKVLVAHMGDNLVEEFSVKLEDDATIADVRSGIDRAVAQGEALVLTSAADMRKAADELLSDFFSLAYAQVAVALVVAFLGVLNSLWIAVMVRQREFGLFRAAGATRSQLVGSIVLQAATLGAVGGAFGVVGGLLIEWIALRRILVADTGWTVAVLVPWGACGAVVAAGVVTSAIAGWFPARAAAATPVREAIDWE